MSAHEYGPHRDEDAPQTVTVYPIVKWPTEEVEMPVPEALMKQRAQINALAYNRRSDTESEGRSVIKSQETKRPPDGATNTVQPRGLAVCKGDD